MPANRSPRLPPVLMLHHVEPHPLVPPAIYPDSYLDPADFAALLDLLDALELATETLATAAMRAAAGEPAPRKTVVLTFDDGCRCFRDHAFPLLEARGRTATLFAVSAAGAQIDGGANDWDRAAGERTEHLLGTRDLAALAERGIEIGSHGRLHRDGPTLSDAALEDELAGSKAELEAALGRAVITYCYPFGRLDARSPRVAERAGYAAAVSIRGAAHTQARDRFAWPREILRPGEGRFERRLKATGLYPLWSRLPRLGLLRALRPTSRERRPS